MKVQKTIKYIVYATTVARQPTYVYNEKKNQK